MIYKGKRFEETDILDIKCHTKKTGTGQFLHRSSCHLQPIFEGFLKGEIIRYVKNNNNEDTFKDKKSFFKEKLLARGYSEAELNKASFSKSFEDRQNYIQENPKTTEIHLVFKTKYDPHYSRKYMKKALRKHSNIITKKKKKQTKNDIPQTTNHSLQQIRESPRFTSKI